MPPKPPPPPSSRWGVVAAQLDRGEPVVDLRTGWIDSNEDVLEGCRQIAASLSNSQGVKALHLVNCKITGVGGALLFESLAQHETLEVLDLSHNRISGTAIFHSPCLLHLNLAHNDIGTHGALSLASMLRDKRNQLQSLNVEDNHIGVGGTVAIMQALERNETLWWLWLGHSQIGYEGAEAVANCLKQNKMLLGLSIQTSGVDDQGGSLIAESLRRNARLNTLRIRGSLIGQGFATAMGESLKKNTSLQELALDHNRMGETGVCALAGGLATNQSLLTLSLRHSQIRSEGVRALCDALLVHSNTLQSLDLYANHMNDEGMEFLARTLRDPRCTLSELNVGGQHFKARSVKSTHALADAVRVNTHLRHLQIDLDLQRSEILLEALRRNTTLVGMGRSLVNRAIGSFIKRNKIIAEKQPLVLREDNFPAGLWPFLVVKWPVNVMFGIFREKPDPLLLQTFMI